MSNKNHSGASAREWRKSIAKQATRPAGYVRTLSFPLDMRGKKPFEFSAAERLYNVTDGVGRGSLMGLLAAVHASGFRLFAQAGGAEIFKNKSVMGDEVFVAALIDAGIEPALSASDIFGLLSAAPRGDNAVFERDAIALRFYRLAKVKPGTVDGSAFAGLIDRIAGNLLDRFDSWSAVGQEMGATLSLIDDALSACGCSAPSLAAKLSLMGDVAPKGSPMVFDDTRPRFLLSDVGDVGWHIILAGHLSEAIARNVKNPLDAAHEAIETSTYNAMSWLFGKGLAYLKTSSVDMIMADMFITDDAREHVEQLVEYARAVPSDDLFGSSLADYRALIGGKISSWISNYASRLDELGQIISTINSDFKLPDALAEAEAEYFYRGMSVDYLTLTSLMSRVTNEKDVAAAALRRLAGNALGATSEDVGVVEHFAALVDRLSANMNQLLNSFIQVREKSGQEDLVFLAKRCEFKLPAWVRPLPALNRLRGGVPDYIGEISDAVAKFSLALSSVKAHYERIDAYCGGLDPFKSLADREAEHLRVIKDKRGHDTSPRRRAARIMLSRFANAARRCGEETQGEVRQFLEPVFKERKDMNKFFFERKGALFLSLFSRSRHHAYDLAENVDLLNWPVRFREFLDEMKARVFVSGVTKARVEDYFRLDRAWYSLMLSGLPDTVPTELAKSDVLEGSLPIELTILLEQDTVPGHVLAQVFNYYHNILNGLNVLLMRDKFFVRTRFQRSGNCHLVYAPKDREWSIPAHYFESESLIRKAIEVVCATSGVLVVPSNALKTLVDGKIVSARSAREFLRQMPHDWCFDLGIAGDGKDVAGVKVKFKEKLEVSKISSLPAYRLVGVSAHKSEIDRAMVEAGKAAGVSIGDVMVVVDNTFEQCVNVGADGAISVAVTDAGYSIKVGLPVKDETQPDATHPFFDRYIAIDQGEIGFAWALFDAKTHDLLKVGHIKVPSIRRLIGAANGFRKITQPKQKFQSRINTGLFSIRENVVGDVCHAIDSLMHEHRAFPVFESTVGNFEQGAKQLLMVYQSVLAQYIYTGVDAHSAVRKAHWCGSDRWVHPYLMAHEVEMTDVASDGRAKSGKKIITKTGKLKPLSIFPGAAVHPAGTSQTCSCCGRNAIRALQDMLDGGGKKVFVKDGVVEMAVGSIRPMTSAVLDVDEVIRLRRRKIRPDLTANALEDGGRDIKDVIKASRKSLRRPPLSLQTNDTTQSRYVCLFVDCEHKEHADVNAAINIGRKFRSVKIAG